MLQQRLMKGQKVKVNQMFWKIYLFVIALVILSMPLSVQAADLPAPVISGEVRGNSPENLAIIVTWKMDDKTQYGYKVEKEGINGKELAVVYNPIDVGDEDEGPGGFYLDTALVPNDTYTYWVTTFDRAGKESEPAKITLVAAVCQPEFTVFDAKNEQGRVTLAWNSVCSAVEYKLYRDGNLVTKTEETNYTDQNVSEGEHEYTIEAYEEKTTSKNIFIDKAMAADPVAKKTIKVTVTGGTTPSTCTNKINTEFGWVCNLADYVSKILNWVIGIVGGLALLMIIYAGYIYMTSQGNPEAVGRAKDIIIGVIVGILLLFLIEIILKTIGIR